MFALFQTISAKSVKNKCQSFYMIFHCIWSYWEATKKLWRESLWLVEKGFFLSVNLLFQREAAWSQHAQRHFVHCQVNCRNFVKELVILFHRLSASPWGHVASIIKRATTEDSPSFCSTPTAVSNRSIRSSPWRQTYLVPSTSQDPRATNAPAELKGTGHTAKFQQAFYLQT